MDVLMTNEERTEMTRKSLAANTGYQKRQADEQKLEAEIQNLQEWIEDTWKALKQRRHNMGKAYREEHNKLRRRYMLKDILECRKAVRERYDKLQTLWTYDDMDSDFYADCM